MKVSRVRISDVDRYDLEHPFVRWPDPPPRTQVPFGILILPPTRRTDPLWRSLSRQKHVAWEAWIPGGREAGEGIRPLSCAADAPFNDVWSAFLEATNGGYVLLSTGRDEWDDEKPARIAVAFESSELDPGAVYSFSRVRWKDGAEPLALPRSRLRGDLRIPLLRERGLAPLGNLCVRKEADNALAYRRMGWKPRVFFREGVQRTIEWYRRHRDPERIQAQLDRLLIERGV